MYRLSRVFSSRTPLLRTYRTMDTSTEYTADRRAELEENINSVLAEIKEASTKPVRIVDGCADRLA